MLLVLALVLGITACVAPGTPDQNQGQTNPPDDNPPDVNDPPVENPPVDNPPVDNPPADNTNVETIIISGAKTDFQVGDSFSSGSLTVKAKMTDGSTKTLSANEYTVNSDAYNCMKVGSYNVTVSANGTNISASYQVNVSPANKLKVLMIGNSYADDTINYAYEIAKSAGIPVENILVADIYIGGCVIDTHWANAQTNKAAYRFGLEREGWFDGSSYEGWTMEQAIKYADWDFITFQQGSALSGVSNSYSNLQNLMDYVYDVATDEVNNPNANPNVKFVWHQTWAYATNSTNSGFANYNYDQMTMYNAIQGCIQTQVLNKDFVAIIPNGTAIQNARTSNLRDTFTRDNYDHLSEDAGRYMAAMGLVATLTGRDMTTITWKPTDSNFNFPMDENMITICKESHANAMAKPFEITESQYPYVPIPEDLTHLFDGKGTQSEPYLIQSAEDLWALSDYTTGKNFTNTDTYFKLTADIDVSADNWNPICSSAATGWVGTANSFNGNFDGNGKTITFVGNYTGDTWAKGLFSAVGGHVHDLTLRGSLTTETGRIGSLASMAMTGAKIENITSYVDITATSNNQVGGIIGYIEADNVTLINCVNYGTIKGRELVGGIVGGGWKNTTYINCVNHGNVSAVNNRCGGIAGEKASSATITGCSNDGTITAGGTTATADTGAADKFVGNLIGKQL